MGLETSQQSTNVTLVFQHQSVAQQCLAFAHKAELLAHKVKSYTGNQLALVPAAAVTVRKWQGAFLRFLLRAVCCVVAGVVMLRYRVWLSPQGENNRNQR